MKWLALMPLAFVVFYPAAIYWLFFMPRQRGLGWPIPNAERIYRRFFESSRKKNIRLVREQRERNIDARQRASRKAGKSALISGEPYL